MSFPGDPARVDVALWRGASDPPLTFEFGDETTPNILNGSDFELVVQWDGGELVRRSAEGGLVITGRRVTWPYSTEDTLAIPRGSRAGYELRRLIAGKSRPWVVGAITMQSGLPRG